MLLYISLDICISVCARAHAHHQGLKKIYPVHLIAICVVLRLKSRVSHMLGKSSTELVSGPKVQSKLTSNSQSFCSVPFISWVTSVCCHNLLDFLTDY